MNTWLSCSNSPVFYVDISVPTDVKATVTAPHGVEVSWHESSSSGVTGYLISYITNASYAMNGSVTVNGGSNTSGTLTDLEEDTLYTITVQAITSDNRMSANGTVISVTTYTASK